MAGRGVAPKDRALRKNPRQPIAHEWQPTEAVGWQHGLVPDPPDGLLKASRDAWVTWMGAWFAAHWTPADLPGLEVLVSLYDQVRRGEHQRAAELRIQMDTYGITPKGQQDRRWAKPEAKPAVVPTPIRSRRLSA